MTGIQSGNAILIPWQVMVNLMKLAQGYGATISSECKKNKEKVFTVLINSEICGNKLWHPKRLGKKMLLKRKFTKGGSGLYVCRFLQSGYYKYVTNENDIPHENTESIVILLYSKI